MMGLCLVVFFVTIMHCRCDYPLNSTDLVKNKLYPTIYKETIELSKSSSPFDWNEVKASILNQTAHAMLLKSILPITPGLTGLVNTTFFVSQPVYISLTTMANRMISIDNTITALLQARLVPTMIFLFISEEPFLMDTGVKKIPEDLLCLVAAGHLRIVYTQNIGPHRKLLPLLKRHWGEDVFIATMDDDMELDQSHVILYQLLKYYVKGGGGNHLVSLRARRIGICKSKPHKSTGYESWSLLHKYNHKEMLVLPTGNGGILYKPKFFHGSVFHKGLRRITVTADDMTFRLATLFMRIPVQLGCIPLRSKGQIVRECEYDDIDRKYDEQFGPGSTQYYYKTTAEVTKRLVNNDQTAPTGETTRRKPMAMRLPRHSAEDKNNSEDNHEQNHEENHNHEDNHEEHHEDNHEENHEDNLEEEHRLSFREVNTAHRMLPAVLIGRVPKAMKTSDLFAFNKNKNLGNSNAWQTATKLLQILQIFDFEEFARKYMGERGRLCMEKELAYHYRKMANCALYECT